MVIKVQDSILDHKTNDLESVSWRRINPLTLILINAVLPVVNMIFPSDKTVILSMTLSYMIFIIVGTIFLIAFGAYYYSMHKNDPDITQTAIEPDSNLAEKNAPKLDTIKVDTISKDSIDKQEKKQAEKILNSVRGRYRSEKNADGDNDEQSETSETETKPKRNNNEVVEMAPVIQNPKVESVETE